MLTSSIQSKHAGAKNDRWYHRLLEAREERASFHMHKVLGISALLSFIYRYSNMRDGRDGNFGPSAGTLFFIVHHFLLNASSFIFDIPARRIKSGFRIWPEYRIHSLVFASRSLANMLLIWCEQKWGVDEPYYLCNVAIVLLTCAAADFGSSIQKYPSSSVRETPYPSQIGKFLASAAQFLATAFCLIGGRRYTPHLVFLTIIQVNAFLMTLQRKNVASPFFLMNCYGALLLGGNLLMTWDDYHSSHLLLPAGTVGHVAIMLRLGPLHVNKYVLWTVLGMAVHILRATDYVEVENNFFWASTFGISFLGMMTTCLWMNRSEVVSLMEKITGKVKSK